MNLIRSDLFLCGLHEVYSHNMAHLIYLFIYLFVHESRELVTWSSVVAISVVSVVSRNFFFQAIVSRISSLDRSQHTQTWIVL